MCDITGSYGFLGSSVVRCVTYSITPSGPNLVQYLWKGGPKRDKGEYFFGVGSTYPVGLTSIKSMLQSYWI